LHGPPARTTVVGRLGAGPARFHTFRTSRKVEPMEDGRALQDVLKVQCFGCGALNAQGLHIKSRWEGDELVCRWRPPPHHIGHPGIVYGGTIASVVDCHAIWTAMATHCRDTGTDIAASRTPFVTGKLSVNYLQPARIDADLVLRARVT